MLEQIDALRLKLLEIHIYLTDARINSTTGLLKIGMDLVHGATQKGLAHRPLVPNELRAAGLGPGLLPHCLRAPVQPHECLLLRPVPPRQDRAVSGAQGGIPLPMEQF